MFRLITLSTRLSNGSNLSTRLPTRSTRLSANQLAKLRHNDVIIR